MLTMRQLGRHTHITLELLQSEDVSILKDFADIRFGYTSAERERAEDPGLLLDGYIDLKKAMDAATTSSKYLFLGYKGAGKSAIGERLELISEGTFAPFTRLVSLKDFPFTPFSKIIRGDLEPEAKFPIAWSWIILIYILESFARDNGITHFNQEAFDDAVRAFRLMGLSPTGEPGKIVRTSSKPAFKLALPGKLAELNWSGSETRPASDIPDFVESLKELLSRVRGENKHYLVIDGLDDIQTSRDIQYRSLGGLVFEVERLNVFFAKNKVPVKIILLCRTDLFERLPGANKNKIRQDAAIELDWYADPGEPDSSLLIQIAQLRMRRTLGGVGNLFGEFFPDRVEGVDVRTHLLDLTRHTPRDFLQLLAHIQQFSSAGKLSVDEIRAGVRDYSIKYFLPEIRDELSDYLTVDEIEKFFRVLGRIRKRDMSFKELITVSKEAPIQIDEHRVFQICEVLFECSALGHIRRENKGSKTYYTFKYRNRHSSFNEKEGIMMHRGLWKAMNVI